MDILSGGRRRKIVVDKSFQYGSAFASALYIIAVGLCLSLPFLYLIRSMNFLIANHGSELGDLLRSQQRITVVAASLYLVGLLVASIFFTLLRSHKIAGPVVNLKRQMELLGRGDFSVRVRLRENDELKDLAESFNAMASRLEEREKRIAERTRRVLSSLKALASLPPGSPEERSLVELEAELESATSSGSSGQSSREELIAPTGRS